MKTVPVTLGFMGQPIGTLMLQEWALPTSHNYVFAMGGRLDPVTGAFELVEVSLVAAVQELPYLGKPDEPHKLRERKSPVAVGSGTHTTPARIKEDWQE